MAIRNQGWAFVSSSVGSTSPGGADTNIQFNNNGSFQGTAKLITDGSGSLSASVNISASSFYGDGSNLTGLTASAVNVADGPETAIQFRVDTPVTGEITGSFNLMFLTASNILKVKGAVSSSGDGRFGALDLDSQANVLTKTTLGSTVVNSSLTSVGTLTSLTSSNGVKAEGTGIVTNNLSRSAGDLLIKQPFGNNALKVRNHSGAIPLQVSSSGLTTISNLTSSNTINAKGLQIDTNGTIGTAGDTDLLQLATSQLTVKGTVSGSGLLKGSAIETDGTATVKGVLSVGPGTGVGYVASNGDSDTRIRFGAAGRGSDSISIEAGGHSFIIIDENGQDELILGTAAADIVHVSGTLVVAGGVTGDISASLNVSASSYYMLPNSGTIAGPSSYLGLDTSNRIVVTAGDGGGGGGGTTINVTSSTADRNYELTFTEYLGNAVKLGGNAGLNYNPNARTLFLSGTSAGKQSSEIALGNASSKQGRIFVTDDSGYALSLYSAGGIDLSGSDGITAMMPNGTFLNVASQFENSGLKLVDFTGGTKVQLKRDGTISGSSDGRFLAIDLDSTANVLTKTTLGSTVVNSSLTSVGTLTSLTSSNGVKADGTGIVTNNLSRSAGDLLIKQPFGSNSLKIRNHSGAVPLQVSSSGLTNISNLTSSNTINAKGLQIDTNGFLGTAGDVNLLRLENNKLGVAGAVSASLRISASAFHMLPTSGSLAGPASYIGLDTSNKLVVVPGDGTGGAASTVNVTSSTANLSYELAFTEYLSNTVRLGGNSGLSFNPAGNAGANGFSGSLTISASHAGKQMSRLLLGSKNQGVLSFEGAGSDPILTLKTPEAGIDISSSNDGGITLQGGDSAGTIVKGNGQFLIQKANGDTTFSVASLTGKATATDVSASVHVSASAYYMLPTTGTIAGPSSYLGLDSRNKIVVTAGDGGGGGGGTTINVTASTANRSYELAFTEFPGSGVKLGLSTGLSFNPAGNAGANGFSGSLTISASHAGQQMSRLLLGSQNDGVISYNIDGSDPLLTVKTSNAGIDISSSNDGGITLSGGDSAGTIVKGNGLFLVQNAAGSTKASIAGSTGALTSSLAHISSSTNAVLFHVDTDSYNAGKPVFLITGSQGVGINNGSPKVALDVHYSGTLSPTSLANDKGGGEVVYFGTSSANLTAGGVYYLNKNGGWESVNSALTGSGHNQLLGIALGTKVAGSGILIKGYFDVNSFYSGSFKKGGPVYIQSSSVLAGRPVVGGGYLSSSAPTAANSYVRTVGYGTDTANVIYFNPDATYVEIG